MGIDLLLATYYLFNEHYHIFPRSWKSKVVVDTVQVVMAGTCPNSPEHNSQTYKSAPFQAI